MNSKETKEIFNKLKEKRLFSERIFGKDFVVINYNDFEPYKKYFSEPVEIGTATNFRSKGYFKHIHAIQRENKVQIHLDNANEYLFKPLFVIHFFLDVIPYFLWHLLKFKKPYKF